MKQAYLEDVPHIRWSSLTPDGISPAVEEALVLAEKGINEVASQEPSKATFASTYGALELATQELDRAWGRVGHLDSVCNSDALREVYNEWLPSTEGVRFPQISPMCGSRLPLSEASGGCPVRK
jgi:oligopeptidase A